MRLEYRAPKEPGWAEITASPIDFDAYPPLPMLRVLWPLGEANVDRTAVASSLIFSPWISGRCDHTRPFSALTEQRIVEWFQGEGIWVAPTPVRSGGLLLPKGNRRLHLEQPSRAKDDRDACLQIRPPRSGSGEEGCTYQIATNLVTLIHHAPTKAIRHTMEVGMAVLVADSLSAGEIVAPALADEDRRMFTSVQRLLESVALGLSDG